MLLVLRRLFLLLPLSCSMTRPYTASERNDTELYKPQFTDRYGDYVFSNSSRWPSEKAVASNISIGECGGHTVISRDSSSRLASRNVISKQHCCAPAFRESYDTAVLA
jgi:hypothetical protein